jgi:hypothetical protein
MSARILKQFVMVCAGTILLAPVWVDAAKAGPGGQAGGQGTELNKAEQVPVDGTWEGTLGIIMGSRLLTKGDTLPFRLIIKGRTAQVFVGTDLTREVKPGKFKVEQLGPNAVIFANDSGQDNDGTWVETWVLVVTLKDSKTLITNYYRVVNNLDMPLSKSSSKFSQGYSGELKRM